LIFTDAEGDSQAAIAGQHLKFSMGEGQCAFYTSLVIHLSSSHFTFYPLPHLRILFLVPKTVTPTKEEGYWKPWKCISPLQRMLPIAFPSEFDCDWH